MVRSTDDESLRRALLTASIEVRDAASGGLVVDVEPGDVGRIALGAGVALTELRAGDGRGLEEIFLDLTADSAREEVAA